MRANQNRDGVWGTVLRQLCSSSALPLWAYHDRTVFEIERRFVFSQYWCCVARERDVVIHGDFVRRDLSGANVVLQLDHNGALNAFANLCPHRAAELVTRESGRHRQIVCPYHGFTFDLDGTSHKPHINPLCQFQLATWNGFVFVNQSTRRWSLREQHEGLEQHAGRFEISALHDVFRTNHTVRANWKLLVENFAESHHFQLVHPELESLTPSRDATSIRSAGWWQGGRMRICDGAETVSRSACRKGRPIIGGYGRDERDVHDFVLWPNLMISVQPDYVLMYRLNAIDESSTSVEFRVMCDATVKHQTAAIEDLVSFWTTVNQQDALICESQQRATFTLPTFEMAFDPSCEEGVIEVQSFVRRVYQNAAASLAVASEQ